MVVGDDAPLEWDSRQFMHTFIIQHAIHNRSVSIVHRLDRATNDRKECLLGVTDLVV